MKLALPSNEFSPEVAAIYCDLEEGRGTAIDTYTNFKYSHNLGELALEGEPGMSFVSLNGSSSTLTLVSA